MLNKLRNIIGKHQFEDPPDQSINPSFVTDPDNVIKLIETVEASSQLCSVKIKGSKTIFSTSLIDFDPKQGYLILDEISPFEGNSILQAVRQLQLSACVNGIPLSFKLDIINYGLKQGIPYYHTGVPNRIYYPQRRKAPRVFIGNSCSLYFQARPKQAEAPITGQVFDLSRNGLCINLTGTPNKYERGDIIKNCRIILPDKYSVTFELAVRSAKTIREQKTQISGYFVSIPPKSKKKLEHHIALLERETIRKQKN